MCKALKSLTKTDLICLRRFLEQNHSKLFFSNSTSSWTSVSKDELRLRSKIIKPKHLNKKLEIVSVNFIKIKLIFYSCFKSIIIKSEQLLSPIFDVTRKTTSFSRWPTLTIHIHTRCRRRPHLDHESRRSRLRNRKTIESCEPIR